MTDRSGSDVDESNDGEGGHEDPRQRWREVGDVLHSRHPELFDSVLMMAEQFLMPLRPVEENISESYIEP
jgi:hypothetical protein